MPVRARKETYGGWQSLFHQNSGIGAAATNLPSISGPGNYQLQSGAGRLDQILMAPGSGPLSFPANQGSGGGCLFYDAAVASSGGPFPASGHKIIVIGPNPNCFIVNSGIGGANVPPNPIWVSMPFQSGLCMVLQSGMQSFTVFWSAEPASNF